MSPSHMFLAVAVVGSVGLSACSGSTSAEPPAPQPTTAVQPIGTSGIRVVTPSEAAAAIADPPADLVILDVRTPEEFDEGHIEGAVMIDFYRDDFAEQLAGLDPDVPYVVYCRSGNRSGQTRAIMNELGFASVADVDGGIVDWQAAGLPVVQG